MPDLKEEIRELKEIVLARDKKPEKEKKFRIPWRGKVKPKKAKQGYVSVWKINENGFIDIRMQKIEQQTIVEDGVPRIATPDYILHYKKIPVIIQPTWSTKPFSPSEDFARSMSDGSNTKGYKILMDRMKSDTTSKKKPMGGMVKWIIGLAIAGLIGYALLTGGG